MRTKDIDITFTIPFPIETPDENGFIYSAEAIKKAISSNRLHQNLPIIYETDKETIIIGHTTGNSHDIEWDDENKVCKITVNGIIDYGGTECGVNKMEGLVIKDFNIDRIGFSEGFPPRRIQDV